MDGFSLLPTVSASQCVIRAKGEVPLLSSGEVASAPTQCPCHWSFEACHQHNEAFSSTVFVYILRYVFSNLHLRGTSTKKPTGHVSWCSPNIHLLQCFVSMSFYVIYVDGIFKASIVYQAELFLVRHLCFQNVFVNVFFYLLQ